MALTAASCSCRYFFPVAEFGASWLGRDLGGVGQLLASFVCDLNMNHTVAITLFLPCS